MRCGKQEHQPGQRCPAKNAKCKECHKIGHFHKVCQSKKRTTQRAHLTTVPQNEDDTHIDELGDRQPNPSRVNMLKVVNHTEANRGKFNEGKHLKFPIVSHPRGPYNHHIVRVDTGADVNCMNEKTFNELFPEVQLLYVTMRYGILETQLQTFQYLDSFIPAWNSGEKSI